MITNTPLTRPVCALAFFLVFWGGAVFADAEADVGDLNWLSGRWTGEGFGGAAEEIWSPAKGGVMMGMFRHHQAGEILSFYEFMTIDKKGLRIKHFHPDMKGWEQKDDFELFPFVEQADARVVFDGLTYEITAPGELKISLQVKSESGEETTEVFTLKRAR